MAGKGDKPRKDFNQKQFQTNHSKIDWRTEKEKKDAIKKTSSAWLNSDEFTGYRIIDPDGWDRANWEYSFYKEKITKREFEWRVCQSTISLPKPQL